MMSVRQILKVVSVACLAQQTLTASAGLVNVTAPDQLAGLKSGVTPLEPIAEAPANQNSDTLFNWLLQQSLGSGPVPINTVLAHDPNASSVILGNLNPYIGDYLVVHWGNGYAGAHCFTSNPTGGFEQAFLIESGGLDSVELTTPTFMLNGHTRSVGGISGWTIFDPQPQTPSVPEPSTIGAGVLCLGFMALGWRRNKSK